jgi:type IV secretory pathway TraG/TraD family ATPase VirD4
MSLESDPKRRVWFVIDELPALQKLPSVSTLLAEGRKYGGCVVAGLQSIPQLGAIYGQARAQSLLDLFNTKIFFRNTDPTTTNWVSKVLGEEEREENTESLSYGANTMRDGINLNSIKRIRPLVLPTEISTLNSLEAYLSFPGNFPITKLQMKYKKGEQKGEAFCLHESSHP